MMMRSKDQAQAIDVQPNGTFDWPDVEAMLLCPVCGTYQDIPHNPVDQSTDDDDEINTSPDLPPDHHT
jgi:hypothetical protein